MTIYYNIYNEDTLFFRESFGFKSYKQGKNILCGFPISRADYWETLFKKHSLSYAFVDQDNKIKSDQKKIIRVVKKSTEEKALNLSFEKNESVKNSEQLQEQIFALSEGFDPFTGEVFDSKSAWKNPEILKMLKLIMDQQSPKDTKINKNINGQSLKNKNTFDDNKLSLTDFFKIEESETFTPITKNTQFSLKNINEFRKKNEKAGNLLNYFVPITVEEIELLLNKQKSIKDLKVLEQYFQRSKKSLSIMIEKYGSVKGNKIITKQPAQDDKNQLLKKNCKKCQAEIPIRRLKVMPNTSLCIDCASIHPSGQSNRKIKEIWGERKDWAQDRWRRDFPNRWNR